MQSKWRRTTAVVLVGLLAAGLGLLGNGWADCTNGTKIPAFLASGVDPNLLLILDNSASMNDLAYIGSQGTCYDDTYSAADTYAGYFERQHVVPVQQRTVHDNDRIRRVQRLLLSFRRSGVHGRERRHEQVTKFAARGNFLNWAATSKLDIQKKILTGGKYDSDGSSFQESRGCLGRRYVKKTAVTEAAERSPTYPGVRPPEIEREGRERSRRHDPHRNLTR